ncbi:MAG TPA: hypothetical protein PKX79_02525 [Spirochaetota bacterium]|jgi:hypothetical protein|nr:hypothetical protein [Spirochaetota bacterium]OQA98468.1 MAG: hypothetical protein BWY23_01087 [Spirochaetes bacterium ADurb.Bin218]HOK01512.1 hypothetical protein [Spirochaetota bacterium]HOK92140.1 hypothetical protein [Spirochaetota bacterium]HON16082.1 hypothetical protein [Spirochaetota bacterium]
MGFFVAQGMKEYKEIASKNNGKVAIILQTRNGKKSPAVELAILASSPREFSIKMNELKYFEKAFKEKFEKQDTFTYCRFFPLNEKFDFVDDDYIAVDGRNIKIKKVPYYTGLLDK